MSNWHLTIIGNGSHHNDQPGDAETLARKAVGDLIAAGQTVTHAVLHYNTFAGEENLLPLAADDSLTLTLAREDSSGPGLGSTTESGTGSTTESGASESTGTTAPPAQAALTLGTETGTPPTTPPPTKPGAKPKTGKP
jgi:hypothetical protein